MLLASNWLSALRLAIRGRVGVRASRSGQRVRRSQDERRVAAERLESRCLLTSYNFVKIADSVAYPTLGDAPALSENGEVAFKGSTSSDNFVLKGSGAALTEIASSTGSLYQFGNPSINASGNVVFWALTDDPLGQVIAVGNGSAAPTTLVSASLIAPTGQFQVLDQSPDINAGGDVSFMGVKPEGTGIFERTAAGGTITTLAQESDGYSAFNVTPIFTSLNNAGGVSFNANLTNGEKVIVEHSGPGGTRTNLRDSSGLLNAFPRTAISQDGDVLSSVILDSGAQKLIRYSNAGAMENVQVDAATTDFLQFEFPNLIDDDGGMVFRGVLDSGVIGIYTGTASGADPVANKVIQNGEMLGGKEISTIVMSSNAANSHGQIAFFVTFTDSSSAIYRADPNLGSVSGVDWGDLPETETDTLPAGYKTTAASGGPSHVITPFLTLGDTLAGPEIDAETDGQPSANADGDNTHGVNDENNLASVVTKTEVRRFYDPTSSDPLVRTWPGSYELEVTFSVSTAATNLTGQPATLYAFADLTRDGDFNDPGETVIQNVPNNSNEQEFHSEFTKSWNLERDFGLAISDPESDSIALNLPFTFAIRHRLSTDDTLNANGPAADGEVEDDLVSFTISSGELLPQTVTDLTFTTVADQVALTATVVPQTPNQGELTGSVDFVSTEEVSRIAVGSGPGIEPVVRVLDGNGKLLVAFEEDVKSFRGGVRVAMGDINGDGVAEIIAVPGPGGDNKVRIFTIPEPSNSTLCPDPDYEFTVSDPLIGSGGLNVAVADVNGDGRDDLIVSGGPKVIVYSGAGFGVLNQFTPFGTSISEVRVAAGDMNGDGVSDLVVATGPGAASSVKEIVVMSGTVLRTFAPFEASFRGGVNLAVGDVIADAGLELVVAKDVGGTPQIKMFDVAGKLLGSAMVFDISSRNGVRVSLGDLNGDGLHEILYAPVLGTSNRIYVTTGEEFRLQFYHPGPDPRFTLADGLIGSLAAVRTQHEFVLGTGTLDTNGSTTITVTADASQLLRVAARYRGSPTHDLSQSKIRDVEVKVLMDYGDAAVDRPIATLLADDGPRHRLAQTGPILGVNRDGEFESKGTAVGYDQADGDDLNSPNGDDEDGVEFLTNVAAEGGFTTAIVTASAAGFLDIFVDQNRDAQFNDGDRTIRDNGIVTQLTNEKLTGHSIPVVAGKNMISIPFTGGARAPGSPEVPGYYVRFRISSAGDLKSFGEAQDGEVEDYFLPLASQDAPINVQLPTGNNNSPAFASFDVFFGVGTMSFAGLSSGGDRTNLFTIPAFTHTPIHITGTAGDDKLRLDFSGSGVSIPNFVANGGGTSIPNFVANGGGATIPNFIAFDGGDEATTTGDSLEFIGGSRHFDSWTASYSAKPDGTVSADNTHSISLDDNHIEFKNIESTALRLVADHATIDARNVPSLAWIQIDPDRPGFGMLSSTAPLDELPFGGGISESVEPISFRAPRLSLTVELGDFDNDFSVYSLPSGFSRYSLTVHGNGGNDKLTTQSLNVPVTLDGGSGDDSLNGGAAADMLIGGTGNNQLAGNGGDDTLEGSGTLLGGSGSDHITGSANADVIDGGSGDDVIDAKGGDDTVNGGDGADSLFGDIGNDVLSGDSGRDTINGGDGHDTISGGTDDDQLTGGAGNDSMDGGDGDDRLVGEAGNDVLNGADGRDSLDGGLNDDQLIGGADNDTIVGGTGNDLLVGNDDNDSLNGGDGNDSVLGSEGDDTVLGGNGDDSVSGDDGDDRVLGQAGNDTVSGGEGLDHLDGGVGSDAIFEYTLNATITPTRVTLVSLDGDAEVETLRSIERASLSAAFSPVGVTLNASAFRGSVTLFGSAFNDTITGGLAADSISGGFGNDSIIGGNGNDTIFGNDGLDTIRGGDGNDSIKGGEGNDSLLGEKGNDTLNGGAGNDTLDGGDGDDGLSGFTGDDSMLGGIGNDTLIGGNGKDTMLGGVGNDICLGKELADSIKGEAGADTLAGGSGAGPDAGDSVTRDNTDLGAALAEAFVFNAAWIDEI